MHSVKDLLQRSLPSLKRVTDQAKRQQFWSVWLAEHLAPEVRERVSAVSEQDGKLVIFAGSAAFAARLRYAVAELEAAIRAADPQLTSVAVRVLPRA